MYVTNSMHWSTVVRTCNSDQVATTGCLEKFALSLVAGLLSKGMTNWLFENRCIILIACTAFSLSTIF